MAEPLFSIIMTVFVPWELLPRALACVMQQRYRYWELLVVVDGPGPDAGYQPRRLIRQLQQSLSQRCEILELPRAAGCFGNVGRRQGLDHVRGDYVVWVNHDNLLTPDYLATHAENIARSPGCLSVVGIDYWRGDRYHGQLPRRLACGQLDLLCYAVPRATALQVNAFGGDASTVYAADWLTFAACQSLLPVERSTAVVGTHF